jgi:hypothetical protein
MAMVRKMGRAKAGTEAPARTEAVHGAAVAQLAYEFYELRGREDGHDVEDWLKAEVIVLQRAANGHLSQAHWRRL